MATEAIDIDITPTLFASLERLRAVDGRLAGLVRTLVQPQQREVVAEIRAELAAIRRDVLAVVSQPRRGPIVPVLQPTPASGGFRPSQRANESRRAAKEPVAGRRICARCNENKPLDDFHVKNKATGNRDAFCKPCRKEYSRERYVKAEELGMVKAGRMRLAEGDPFIGDACVACGVALEAGDEVAVGDIEMRHCRCPGETT